MTSYLNVGYKKMEIENYLNNDHITVKSDFTIILTDKHCPL